ncbi:MAG: hypothetical protein OHK93_007465 [Ramalina farinacea]|uniref:Uncharacterized protein n=1 Tax=Ramalina farinacea TaxID=258253 RepID=A0AA43TQZ7_9LECA|nr:hypothetical protein [Ramalina farinacea]
MEKTMQYEGKSDLDWKGPSEWPEDDKNSVSGAVPPPYQPSDQRTHPNLQDPQHLHPNEKASSSSSRPSSSSLSATAPQPNNNLQQQPPVTRTFDMNYKNWKMCGVHVTDTATNTILYKADLRLRKPHIILTFPNDSQGSAPLGTVTYHYTSFRIDTTVRGHALTLHPFKFCGRKGHTFASRALNGQTLRWKCERGGTNLLCVDERDVPLARYRFSCFSLKKCGSMELLGERWRRDGDGDGDEATGLLDEVMVTGAAMIEWVYTMRMSAVGAPVVTG